MGDNGHDPLGRTRNDNSQRLMLMRTHGAPTAVLDHGYVMLLDVMGDDHTVVDSARVSYAEGCVRKRGDEKLLRHLLRSRHTSPFEQCRIRLEVKLPIFVERQWVRHRMASLNEMSARYSKLPGEFYYPDPEVVRAQSRSNKQGRDEALPDAVVDVYLASLRAACTNAYAAYEHALDNGVARELARCLLPVNIYTKKVWAADLHNLLHFLALRMDPHAQWEIRQYANAIAEIVKAWVPWTWQAFVDYRREAMGLSRMEVLVTQGMMQALDEAPSHAHDAVELLTGLADHYGMTRRETDELIAKLGADRLG